jgi:signal transduction histidine kinase
METYERNFKLLEAGEAVRFEMMIKKPFIADDIIQGKRIEGETWILAAGYPIRNPDGSIRSIQGALIDISRQKWMETFQERRMAELIELKRQQENFMDMVGHEVRNPLSAITLCAESILDSLETALATASPEGVITIPQPVVESHIENAEVITTCIQHQRRIIDDVLTLSKLDSGLLVIAPCEVQPAHLVEQSLRMFAGEVQEFGINLKYNVEDSYKALNIDWVLLDPSRLLQINLNLVTNAIKFTRSEPVRNITVSLSASTTRPTHSPNGTTYLSAAPDSSDAATTSPPQTSGEQDETIYLMIAVSDSGIGIPEQELTNIFLRFQQSSPKTHVRYGGSGLGLFISRELARLQGGRMGVASEYGKGSTFEFYVKTKRCAKPEGGRMPPYGGSGEMSEGRRTSLRRMFSENSGAGTAAAARIAAPTSTTAAATTTDGATAPTSTAAVPIRNGNKTPSATAAQNGGEKLHILLVEDNLVNQKVMSKQLTNAGHEVAVANHGLEAMEYVRRTSLATGKQRAWSEGGEGSGKSLDVVLMDIEMPVCFHHHLPNIWLGLGMLVALCRLLIISGVDTDHGWP